MDAYLFTEEQQKLLEGLSNPLAVYQFVDKRVVTLALSNGFCKLFGYADQSQAYGDRENDRYKSTHPDDIARISEAALRFATEGGTLDVVFRSKKDGDDGYRIIHAIGEHVYTDEGVRLAHVWYTDEGEYADGTDAQQTKLSRILSNELREYSAIRAIRYDYLTGLPSMTYFFELADEGMKHIRENSSEPVMLYMDLSGMKYFNTQNSFSEGDELLREFARVLKDTFSNENCCRIAADHFAVFTDENGLEETILQFMRTCEKINGGNNLPVKIGIYHNRLEDVNPSKACDRAKFACDSLGNAYKSCFAYYDIELRDDAERRHYILTNFEKAIDEQWIQVYYQPIIRAVNGRVCEEEALSRWVDPNMGLLSPAEFIPALEDARQIYKLDLYVLDRILDKMKMLKERGFSIIPHSINLSRSDFLSCDIVEEIRKRVDDAGIDRDKITIEVTESVIGDDSEFMKMEIERFAELGFPVWMDDFGSGYSSIDLLQSIKFDLIKFDMSFMSRLDEGDGPKIILTELIKMATSLGVVTLCEGVETAEQVRFLQEVGCSKLQGYYFCKPVTFEEILERYDKGIQIGYENPAESSYFADIGSVNLYDLGVLASDDDELRDHVDTLPMGVLEIGESSIEYVRTNRSYRDFLRRFFGFDLDTRMNGYLSAPNVLDAPFTLMLRQCCAQGGRMFYEETMPDGTFVRSFAKRIGTNPVTRKTAVAVAVLSISEETEGATYASIAHALAADYYNIYSVDLNTEKFIEYSSQVGGEDLAVERHGEDFFESARHETMTRIYEEDRERFLSAFSKEKVVLELNRQGVFTASYRLIDSGEPVYANMKITRMRPGSNQIIVGISIVDSQMKQQEFQARMQRERDVLKRAMALSGQYLSMYAIDPDTGRYFEYNVTDEFASLGYANGGDDFFKQAGIDAQTALWAEDVPGFLEWCNRESILKEIEENGSCSYSYRLNMHGEPTPVSLKIAKVEESGGVKLVAGVRLWQTRQSD